MENKKQVGGNHYSKMGIQVWDYIISNDIGYMEGNIIKYVSRWRDKGGVEDLEKARHYLDKLIGGIVISREGGGDIEKGERELYRDDSTFDGFMKEVKRSGI